MGIKANIPQEFCYTPTYKHIFIEHQTVKCGFDRCYICNNNFLQEYQSIYIHIHLRIIRVYVYTYFEFIGER